MNPENLKIGITIENWDVLRADPQKFAALQKVIGDQAAIILSQENTIAQPVAMRDFCPRTYVADHRTLSPLRLARLCRKVFHFDGAQLQPRNLDIVDVPVATRFGYIVSNGFGLGHVTRMQAIAEGLAPYGKPNFMSFSAGLVRDAFYLPSQQYLALDKADGLIYTREATLRFFNHINPTHVFYDGNNIPEGVLAALADRPHVHLTWIRRGMWQPGTDAKFMAGQALADLVIEPGDLSEGYDTGPSWNERNSFCPPGNFLKTKPIKPAAQAPFEHEKAMYELTLDKKRKHALLMLGASQKTGDLSFLKDVIEQVRKTGLVPIIAHWPISHDEPPRIQWSMTIERMPISKYYNAFDVIISAAGYNSFHELLAGGYPTIFMPQEDEGRDQQLARSRYAADQGLAQICRRPDVERLHELIPLAKATTGKADWLTDYGVIAKAINVAKVENSKTVKFRRIMPNSKTLLREYRTWRRGKKTYKNTFVLALDMDSEKFFSKAKKLAKDTTIVITDTVDPIQLRRAGFKYIWVNRHMLSGYGLTRQFMMWLTIWKPKKIRNLNSRFG